MSTSHQIATPEGQAWRESVLSTRSLSYVSNIGSMAHPSGRQPNHYPFHREPTRQNTLNSASEYSEDEDLEMAGTQVEQADPAAAARDIPELPDSVANSLLFELPREIRDRIYSLCLVSRDALPVEWPRPREAHTSYHLQPQLLRTCRIIHDESAALLYTLNNMTFHHPSDANMFVRAIAASHGHQITNLSLHIKAQDMRLWMPYVTSADKSRSLKADFPNLKELGVRFRSNKWAHQHTPDSNLKTWHEDSRLDEVINGLRHVFMPENPPEPISEREFQEYMARNPTAFFQEAGDNYHFKKRMLELQKALANTPKHRYDTPGVRVCCACRVHAAHFAALTEPRPTDRVTGEELPPPVPVREGEVFNGFSAVDLQNGVKRLHDPDLGSANVARTPYANKRGILIALEIHCLDPKKDPTERTA